MFINTDKLKAMGYVVVRDATHRETGENGIEIQGTDPIPHDLEHTIGCVADDLHISEHKRELLIAIIKFTDKKRIDACIS